MFPIKDTTKADAIFGCGNLAEMMPAYRDIPDEFKRGHTKWNRLVSAWFFGGLQNLQVTPKEGVDRAKALAHIRSILASFEPKHEHKEAGCAFLLNEWFSDATWERATKRADPASPPREGER